MSFKMKFTLVLFVILVVGMPMLIKGPDGRPLMTVNDWIPDADTIPAIPVDKAAINGVVDQLKQVQVNDAPANDQLAPASLSPAAPTTLSSGSGKMYKWQDENGRWHFSSQKPMNSTQVSMEQLPEVENVMEAPVNQGDNSSSIRFPGGFDLGQ